jgi:hypothetical protein
VASAAVVVAAAATKVAAAVAATKVAAVAATKVAAAAVITEIINQLYSSKYLKSLRFGGIFLLHVSMPYFIYSIKMYYILKKYVIHKKSSRLTGGFLFQVV